MPALNPKDVADAILYAISVKENVQVRNFLNLLLWLQFNRWRIFRSTKLSSNQLGSFCKITIWLRSHFTSRSFWHFPITQSHFRFDDQLFIVFDSLSQIIAIPAPPLKRDALFECFQSLQTWEMLQELHELKLIKIIGIEKERK